MVARVVVPPPSEPQNSKPPAATLFVAVGVKLWVAPAAEAAAVCVMVAAVKL
jgi:hypothetical protein